MRVLLVGATGAIGRPLVGGLLDAGHSVIGVTRTQAGASRLRELGADPLVADVMDRDALLKAVEGLEADAIVHQGTALSQIKSPRVKPNDPTTQLRIRGTAHLLAAARAMGARRFLTQSLVLGYGYIDHGSTVLTEDAPFGRSTGKRVDVVLSGLKSTENQIWSAEGIEGISLRYGIFYGPGTWTEMFADLLRKGRMVLPPHRGQVMMWVHIEDAAAATVTALEHGKAGEAYNIVDDSPASWREMMDVLADTIGVHRARKVPAWVLRVGAPYLASLMVDTSIRVSNDKAKTELGWSPAFPSVHSGIGALPDWLKRAHVR